MRNPKIGSYKTTWPHVIRWAIHFPLGLAIAFIILNIDAVLGVVVAYLFIIYERMEDKKVNDWSFVDVFGTLVGLITWAFVHWLWF